MATNASFNVGEATASTEVNPPYSKGKVIPVQGCERLRLPYFQSFGTPMAARLSALCAGRFLPPGTHFC
jgi:hypothetical protein